MRIAHLGDLHITSGARLEDHRETLTAIVDAILATEPDLVLIGGDLTGRTVPHRSTPDERDVLYPAIARLAERAPVILVSGNHDDETDIRVIEQIRGEWPIRVATVAEVIAVNTPSGRANVYALPYVWKRWLLAGETIEGGVTGAQRAVEERLGQLLTGWASRIRRRRLSHPDEPHVGLMHVQIAGCETSGGEVLAGQEVELTRYQVDGVPFDYLALGHLHKRQEVALRAWYPGSPWRNDYSETDPKGWHLVDIGAHAYNDRADGSAYESCDRERLACFVAPQRSPCRLFVTLSYRWAPDHDDGQPRWIERPTDAEIAACVGAEVRMRLIVSEAWVGGCPWDDEVTRVRAVAHRVQPEPRIAPVFRVRAPEVAAAVTDEDKLRAYWRTLATMPDENEQAAAIEALREIAGGDADPADLAVA